MAKDISFYTPDRMGGLDVMVGNFSEKKNPQVGKKAESRYPLRLGRLPRPKVQS